MKIPKSGQSVNLHADPIFVSQAARVGDTVVIMNTSMYKGEVGVIIGNDGGDPPLKIQLGGGKLAWRDYPDVKVVKG